VFHRDQTFFETHSIDDVLLDDNIPGKEIASLYLAIERPASPGRSGTDSDSAAQVAFDADDAKERVFLSLRGVSRDWTFILADDLQAQVSRSLSRRRFRWILGAPANALVGLALFASSIALGASWMESRSHPLTNAQIASMTTEERVKTLLEIANRAKLDMGYPFVISMVVGFALAIVCVEARPLAKLYGYFDRSVFYWGDMKSVHDRRQRLGNQLVWGVGAAFVLSVLSTWVASQLF
jgi:hypothetical protein